MKKSRKAVFFDIDGTLYDFGYKVPESTKEAIKSLRENGHYAFINTGRSRVNITDEELGGIKFDGIVASCGTYVEWDGKCLLNHEWPQELVDRTTDFLRSKKMELILEGSHKMYYYPEDPVSVQTQFQEFLEKQVGKTIFSALDYPGDIRINKLSFQTSTPERIPDVMEKLPEELVYILHSDFVEVLPKGFNKAAGIAYVCKQLGVKKEDTYAFGDSNNDLDMLKYAGCGVAMGNCTEKVRKICDYLTAPLYEDGISKGLRHVGLI